MHDVINIVIYEYCCNEQALKDSNILLKGITKTVKNETN